MDWLDYRKQLKIGFCDDEKVKYFFHKIFNALNSFESEASLYFGANGYFNFCNTTGTPMGRSNRYNGEYGLAVNTLSKHTNSLEEFLAYYMAFANSFPDNKNSDWRCEHLHNLIENMLDESHIPYEIIRDKDGAFLFPKGAEEMDAALVSQPLSWLSAYPKAHTAYVKALKEYSEATPDNASDIAYKLRKALETFFQEFFVCDKSLENCKSLYGGYLKSQNVPPEITANFETLLQAYTNFINAYAKHHDKTGLNILEYLMYQTGNIIRLLITLKQAESA